MNLSDRLNHLMNERRISITELSKALGITYEMVRRYTLGTAEPRKDKLEKIAEYLQTDPSWLQFGVGNEPTSIPLAQLEQDDEHSHRIDYLDVRAAAGLIEYSNADCPEIIRSIWLSDDGMLELVGKRNARGLHIINVPTDSMEPTIPKGSPVVIDTSVNGYTGDGIYAFSINGNLFIKRIQKLMKGGYKIISDNKARYEAEEIDDAFLDNAVFVGKFLRVWKIEACEL